MMKKTEEVISDWSGEIDREFYEAVQPRRRIWKTAFYSFGVLWVAFVISAAQYPKLISWMGRDTKQLTLEEALDRLADPDMQDFLQENAAYAVNDWIEKACLALENKANDPDPAGRDAANYLGRIAERRIQVMKERNGPGSVSPHQDSHKASLAAIRRLVPPQ